MDEANHHRGHRQRVKDRYLREGLDHFKDHELLEFLLFYCVPQKDTKGMAYKLLDTFGSLHGVLEAPPEILMEKGGLTQNMAIFLSALPAMGRRYMESRWGDRPRLDSYHKAGQFAVTLMMGRPYEVFYVVCLDAQNRLIHADLIHKGTVDQSPVYPRTVVEAALSHHAVSVILAHNHPGGTLNPSVADVHVTDVIRRALKPISINVLDHIVVAGDQFFSFAKEHLLEDNIVSEPVPEYYKG
ncbi:RadC family protein [Gehongia tenuis]|uniref:DNA repair protein RadC n=1 Tax=Gehongia tenuis TaxID=2763655 RepID=A0A926D653_9FIRM|nr:DNA repair protein RadC [Gehongia tenuis]MBC8532104.1 DNA repair protein RadC [Gehongia tenuis]